MFGMMRRYDAENKVGQNQSQPPPGGPFASVVLAVEGYRGCSRCRADCPPLVEAFARERVLAGLDAPSRGVTV
jgi:hypothetical protein